MLRRYAHKQGVADANIAALRAGGDECADLKGSSRSWTRSRSRRTASCMSGNQAIALGAIAAGVQYFAGYPITPASDILEWLSAKLPQVGGITIQCEDEIASLASVLGASYTGVEGDDGDLGPRPVADDGGARLRRHGGDPLRDHRRPARRPLDRPADQDRAVRPAARPLRRPRRGAARRRRADLGGGLLLDDDRRLQLLRALPGPGHPPHRPGPGDADGGHPQARLGQGRAVGAQDRRPAATTTTSATR